MQRGQATAVGGQDLEPTRLANRDGLRQRRWSRLSAATKGEQRRCRLEKEQATGFTGGHGHGLGQVALDRSGKGEATGKVDDGHGVEYVE